MTSELKADWYLVQAENGNVIYHTDNKQNAETYAAKYGRRIVPLYARRPISAEDLHTATLASRERQSYSDHDKIAAALRALGHEVEEGE